MIITPIQPTGDFSTCAVMFACVPVQIVDAYTKAETDVLLAGKQKLLIAGDNITIEPDGTINSTGGGAIVHNDLLQRDAADAHPIGAISGLQAELDSKLSTLSFEDKYADTIKRWINVFPSSYNASVDVVNETFSVVGETIGIEDAVQTLSYNLVYTDLEPMFKYGDSDKRKSPKVLIPKCISGTSYYARLYANNTIEVVLIRRYNAASFPINLGGLFFRGRRLLGKEYVNGFDTYSVTSNIEEVDLIFTSDTDISVFSKVTFDNMELLLNQADNGGTSVTWTLHPDIFDKITNATNPDYPQWSALATLATSKNIVIGV